MHSQWRWMYNMDCGSVNTTTNNTCLVRMIKNNNIDAKEFSKKPIVPHLSVSSIHDFDSISIRFDSIR